jgi:hypothetical protein
MEASSAIARAAFTATFTIASRFAGFREVIYDRRRRMNFNRTAAIPLLHGGLAGK